MRVTAARKAETERRIVAAARALFEAQGYEATTTRAIARDAGVAAGTLFNYFPNKHSLGMRLIQAAEAEGRAAWTDRRRPEATLTESLFGHISAGLRELRPYRGFVGEVFEATMSPFARPHASDDSISLQAAHLETVEALVTGADRPPLSYVQTHLYWSLYLGVLAFWTRDGSPDQEDTLVVLDEALRLFVNSLGEGSR